MLVPGELVSITVSLSLSHTHTHTHTHTCSQCLCLVSWCQSHTHTHTYTHTHTHTHIHSIVLIFINFSNILWLCSSHFLTTFPKLASTSIFSKHPTQLLSIAIIFLIKLYNCYDKKSSTNKCRSKCNEYLISTDPNSGNRCVCVCVCVCV